MTAVQLWFRDSFETEIVDGDLVTLTNNLNIAQANGHRYAILEDTHGKHVMVETSNIIRARETDDTAAPFIGN